MSTAISDVEKTDLGVVVYILASPAISLVQAALPCTCYWLMREKSMSCT